MKDCLTGIAPVHRGQVGRWVFGYFLCFFYFPIVHLPLRPPFSPSIQLPLPSTFLPFFTTSRLFSRLSLPPSFAVWTERTVKVGLLKMESWWSLSSSHYCTDTAEAHAQRSQDCRERANARQQRTPRALSSIKSILKGVEVYHSWSFIEIYIRMVGVGSSQSSTVKFIIDASPCRNAWTERSHNYLSDTI